MKKKKLVLLALGMVYAKDIEKIKTRSQTTSSIVRDTLRLQNLEELGYEVWSLSDSSYEETKLNHIRGKVGSSIVKELKKEIKKPLDLIVGDYVRMPPSYFELLYQPFLTSMLPALIQHKLIHSDTLIFLPNRSCVSNFYHSTIKEKIPVRIPVRNPLFVVGEKLHQKWFGKTTNKQYAKMNLANDRIYFMVFCFSV